MVKGTKRDDEERGGEREEEGNSIVNKGGEKRESEMGGKRFLAWRNKRRKLMVGESGDED